MSTSTQHGYLVIADISGYTSFMAKTELEHSQEILAKLPIPRPICRFMGKVYGKYLGGAWMQTAARLAEEDYATRMAGTAES